MDTPTFNKRWSQTDYNYVKNITSDEFDLNGPSGGSSRKSPGLEFDIGNSREINEVEELSKKLKEELEEGDMNVEKIKVESGYRGATNQALLLTAYFGSTVYQK